MRILYLITLICTMPLAAMDTQKAARMRDQAQRTKVTILNLIANDSEFPATAPDQTILSLAMQTQEYHTLADSRVVHARASRFSIAGFLAYEKADRAQAILFIVRLAEQNSKTGLLADYFDAHYKYLFAKEIASPDEAQAASTQPITFAAKEVTSTSKPQSPASQSFRPIAREDTDPVSFHNYPGHAELRRARDERGFCNDHGHYGGEDYE